MPYKSLGSGGPLGTNRPGRPTRSGRMLEVVLDPEPLEGVFYVVTAHPASKKDRALYEHEKGGGV